MFARMARIALVLAAVAPGVAVAQGFEYAPGSSQYRITQTTKITQEAMGQKQDMETSSYQLISVTVARLHKDTVTLAATMDSVSQTGPMGPPPGLDKLIGMRADAKISPTGALYTASVKDSTIMGASDLANGMGRFYPRIRGRLAMGSTWSDTTSGKLKQQGLEIDRKTISKYMVTGDTTVAGEKSWKVQRTDSTTMSGSGLLQGQAITMEGTSAGKGDLYVGQRGTFGGGQGSEMANIKLVLAANGLEINIVQNANSKVEKVK
jgi:hypothetical protein